MQRHRRLISYRVSLASLCCALVLGGVLPASLRAQTPQPRPEDKVKRLLKLLDSTDDPDVWLSTVTLLGDLTANPVSVEEISKPGAGSDEAAVAAQLIGYAIQNELRELASDRLAKRLAMAEKPLDPRLNRAILLALGRLRAPVKSAAPAWLKALKDRDATTRLAVINALESYLSRAKEIRDVFPNTDRQVDLVAQYVQDMAGSPGVPGVPAVIRAAIEDRDPQVKTGALTVLSQLLAELDKLETLPRDEKETGRPESLTAARSGLPAVAHGLSGLHTALEAILASESEEHQQLVMQICDEMERLRDPRVERGQAVGRLLQTDLGSEGPKAAEMLTETLRKMVPAIATRVAAPKPTIRIAALGILELLGPEAVSVVPSVAGGLHDPDRFVRWGAARALGRIGSTKNPRAIKGLGELVGDDDLDVASAAARALEAYGPDALAAVPALAKALARDDPDLRLSILFALRAIGPDERNAATVVPAITAALDAAQPRVRREVPPALGKYGPAAKAAVPALKALLEDPDPEVQQHASEALLKILGKE